MSSVRIQLPYKYVPRNYQLPFFEAMDSGKKRAVLVHHRRAGKDLACFNFLIKEAYRVKDNYWYMLPEYSQARKAIWEGKTDSGMGYLDFIPKEILKKIDNHEMKIELKNGSIIRLVGSDSDSLVGSAIRGIVLSEYSLIRPNVWGKIEPMLLERNGWAVFNGTPRGENHFYHLYMMAKDNPRWFASLMTVNETGVFTSEQIANIREEKTKTEEDIQQEYFCSFRGSISGAYYSEQFDKIESDNRILDLEYEDLLPVHTAWDLGVADATAIWFYQKHNNQIRIIDSYQATGEGLPHFVQVLKNKGYIYGNHYAPHDIAVRELGTGKSRLEQADSLGLRFRVVKKIPIIDGINCVRSVLKRCYFDRKKCGDAIQALKQYRKKWDEERQCFDSKPRHDWSSHFSDAFRYLCVSLEEDWDRGNQPVQKKAIAEYVTKDGYDYNFIFTQQQQPKQTNYLKESSWHH